MYGRFDLTFICFRYLFHGLSAEKASQQLVRLLSSLRCTQNISDDDGEVADLGSIFEIEPGSEPPPTISFKTLSAAAVEATRPPGVREVSVRDLSLTFQRAMGLEFERLERTPFRPQVKKHSGKFGSFQEALQDTKGSGFQVFTPELLQFSFSSWPALNDASDCIIAFAPSTLHPVQKNKIIVNQLNEPLAKPSESVGSSISKTHKCAFTTIF